jgi:hypothetical protein
VCIEIRKPSLLRTMQVMPTSAYRTGYEGIKVWQLCPLLRRTGLASENPGLARIHLVSCRLSPMCFPWSKPSIPEADSSLCTPSPLLHPAQPPPPLILKHPNQNTHTQAAHGTPAPHATSLPPWRYPAWLRAPAVLPLRAHH